MFSKNKWKSQILIPVQFSVFYILVQATKQGLNLWRPTSIWEKLTPASFRTDPGLNVVSKVFLPLFYSFLTAYPVNIFWLTRFRFWLSPNANFFVAFSQRLLPWRVILSCSISQKIILPYLAGQGKTSRFKGKFLIATPKKVLRFIFHASQELRLMTELLTPPVGALHGR